MSTSKAPLAAFRKAPAEEVLVHPQHEPFAYSDGQEVEHRILQTLRDTADLSVGSQELMSRIQDWPTEYHFIDTRANLLRHLPFGPGVRVLELGAGCGALTRYLGEAGCEVVAVEGSLLRARCASERTRDLGNVSVHCANFQDIAFEREFDVVTLIGVLEYAPAFFDGEDPIRACLEVARSALAPGGSLVLAIENQLGLKYFAGATEDHLGTHFSGIENRYPPKRVRTMGRQAIQRALHAAGFAEVAFQFPFPDYKLPAAIVFESALARADFRPSELVRHLYARDYAGRDLQSIDAAQLWPVLEENGLLGELSNSFLIVAREASAGRAARGATDEVLALAYSTGRARRFQTCTSFRVAADGSITSEKTLVYPAAATELADPPGISHRLTREAYVQGPTLHSTITAALRDGDAQRVIALLRRWLAFLADIAGTQAAGPWRARLPGEYWDCTPANLIESNGSLRYFDAEWISDPGPTVENLLLHYVFILAFGSGSARHFAACFKAGAGPATRRVVEALGLPLTQEVLDEYARDCNAKNAVIFPLKPKVVLDRIQFRKYVGPARSAVGRLASRVLHRVSRVLPGGA